MIRTLVTRHLSKRQKWTQWEVKLLCQLWWVHCHHVGEKGVIYLFRTECQEKGIICHKSDKALHAKINTIYSLYNGHPTHCSSILRRIFAEVRHELGDQ